MAREINCPLDAGMLQTSKSTTSSVIARSFLTATLLSFFPSEADALYRPKETIMNEVTVHYGSGPASETHLIFEEKDWQLTEAIQVQAQGAETVYSLELAQLSPAADKDDAQLPSLFQKKDRNKYETDLKKKGVFAWFNHLMFQFNDWLYHKVIRPLLKAYRAIFPFAFRRAALNMINLLQTPIIVTNDLLQLNFKNLHKSIDRFLLNAIGGLGIVDVARKYDLPYRTNDFGVTLGRWGIKPSQYIVLPFLGPSNLRDSFGIVLENLYSPTKLLIRHGLHGTTKTVISNNYTGWSIMTRMDRYLDSYFHLQESSLDFPAAYRTAYEQQRRRTIQDAKGKDLLTPNMDVFFNEDYGDDNDNNEAPDQK